MSIRQISIISSRVEINRSAFNADYLLCVARHGRLAGAAAWPGEKI